jgi:hypothetical protein
MTRAPIIAAGGALVVDGLIADSWFAALQAEGLAARVNAREQIRTQSDPGRWREGNPCRWLASAEGGPVQTAVYADRGLSSTLARLAGHSVRPTGGQGTYSYYDRPGHFLGLHRDIRRCDLALITCLQRAAGVASSGALRLYPKSTRARLETIGPDTPARDIEMQPGQSILLLGGCVPHEVLPAAAGFSRSVSVLCFEIVT